MSAEEKELNANTLLHCDVVQPGLEWQLSCRKLVEM